MQFRIWDALRKAPFGMGVRELLEVIYGHKSDGGPEFASQCLWGHVFHANKKLKEIGQRIVSTGGAGSIYRLEIYTVQFTILSAHKEFFAKPID